MSLLFDTPGVSVPASAMAAQSAAPPSNKRKRKATDDAAAPPSPAVNLDKLMKQMQKLEKDSGWGGGLGAGGKTGVKVAEDKAAGKKKKEQKKKNKAAGGAAGGGAVVGGSHGPPKAQDAASGGAQGGREKQQRGPPARNPFDQEGVNAIPLPTRKPAPSAPSPAKAPTPTPAPAWKPAKKEKPKQKSQRPDNAAASSSAAVADTPKKSVRHTAPTTEDTEAEPTPVIPQTAMQASLRAKLAGGKFRMLNETLYTSTGDEAWKTMKEDGAFDDYHAGFRSQASHWPVQPLGLLTTSLSTLASGTFIADFGCGDAALAKALVPKGLNVVSFDLVSKDGWVIEAECSSVPLPGGTTGSEIVDVVVCCLSLMGTDWIEMIREAKRVLKVGGEIKIAEVTSRFTDVDAFVALVETVGFKLLRKDTTNTHFMMFDFNKTGDAEDRRHKAESTKKAPGLLKPCIYKKR